MDVMDRFSFREETRRRRKGTERNGKAKGKQAEKKRKSGALSSVETISASDTIGRYINIPLPKNLSVFERIQYSKLGARGKVVDGWIYPHGHIYGA